MPNPPDAETGKFSVCQFFSNDTHEYVRRDVSAAEAKKAFEHYTTSVAARTGMTVRVIITDDGDMINVEWEYGKGITFPTPEMIAEHERSKGGSG
jgi:hypothetical protein